MSLRALIGALAASLILSACSTPPVAQTFIRDHLQCTAFGFGNPQWSPDGALIYYSLFRTPAIDLRVMDSSGMNDHLLASDVNEPLLSPDGSMILFERPSLQSIQSYDYNILDLKSMVTRHVAQSSYLGSWSPDSKWIVYAAPPMTIPDLRKTNVQTEETIQLTDGSALASAPHWSPDGQAIVYTSAEAGHESAIYLMHADGSAVTPLIAQPLACPAHSAASGDTPLGWLPDGKSLAVLHACDSDTTLHVVTAAGVETVDLSSLGQNISDVAWSPDGKQIAFTSTNAKVSALNIANADGSAVRLLQAGGASPAWSPDGKLIAFAGMDSAGLPEIFTIKPDGSGLTQLTQNPGGGHVCPH